MKQAEKCKIFVSKLSKNMAGRGSITGKRSSRGREPYTGRFFGKEAIAGIGTRGGVGVSGGLVLVLAGSAKPPPGQAQGPLIHLYP
ncbi:MAG TPA: hypothetical protein VGN15_07525, partial [Ktedonobacteraceae bacterium]|nr:hypothetical protein [Ktedonobacteraceae bacterium]